MGMDSKLDGVEKTMLLPLWGRYTESKKENGLIKDRKCIEIVEKMNIDLSGFETEQNPGSRLAWVARAWNIDFELSRLAASDSELTVVCLGCGLDTAFFRLTETGTHGARHVHWYDIDLPRVIEIRRKLIGEAPECTMIAGSVLEAETYKSIQVRGKLVILAAGLLYYFSEAEVQRIFHHLAEFADAATVVIDFCSEQGVAMANKLVLHNSADTRMIWSAEDEAQLRALDRRIRHVETYPTFQKILPYLSEGDAQMAEVSDKLQIQSFAVMELGGLT